MAIRSLLGKQVIDRKALDNMAKDDLGPATPSVDHAAMAPYLQKSKDLLDGLDAVMAGAEDYLPRHPEEEDVDYQFRLANGVLTNIFADIIETLAAKPFDEEVGLREGSASEFFIGKPILKPDPADPKKQIPSGHYSGGFIEDVDGKGTHIGIFANEHFEWGIASAIDWIFVDYPKVPPNLTLAQEKALNIRPYWYRVSAIDMLEVRTAMVGGREERIYARIHEWADVRTEGFTSVTKQRVREIERPKIVDPKTKITTYGIPEWKLWERDDENTATKEMEKWSVVDDGVYSIGLIPLVPLPIGRRVGSTQQYKPPMKTAADLQIEVYQQETGLKNNKTLSCYPMLKGVGVDFGQDADGNDNESDVTVGPHTVLTIPPSPDGSKVMGDWNFIEPSATSQKFLAEEVKALKADLRELGRAPLSASSGNITVITSAFAAQKANCAVQAWGYRLKDTLENALLLTAKWMKLNDEPEVMLDLDFPIGADDTTTTNVETARTNGDISRKTYWGELKRRGILAPEFDAKAEEVELKNEIPSDGALNADDLAAGGVDKSKKVPK